MKVFIVLFALAAIVAADWTMKSPEEILNIRKQCFTEVSVPVEYQEQIQKFEYADVEVVHKFIECSMKKNGVFDETTGYNVDHFVNQLGHGASEVRPLVEDCIKEKTATDVWGVWICLVKKGFLSAAVKGQIQH